MPRPCTILAVATAAVLFAAACGDDGAGTAASTTSGAADVTTTSGPEATTSAPTTSAPTSTVPPTTVAPAGAEPLDPDQIHDLVVRWADADGEPLTLAEDLIAFPLAVPVPSGSTAHSIDVRLRRATGADTPYRWEWAYGSLAPGPVGDVDLDAPDNGAGATALFDEYDPIMAGLGWSYSNTTASDPGERGGPSSVNHVFTADDGVLPVAGTEATALPAFVWLVEDVIFDGPEEPGHEISVSAELDDATVPVPLLATLDAAVSVDVGHRLAGAHLRSLDRAPDSFDAAEGLRYLQAELEWVIDAADVDAAQASIISGLDDAVLQPGEESFFDEGTIELVEPTVAGDTWSLPVIVVDRYEGVVEIFPTVDDPATARLRLRVDLEPGRELLTAPS